jgi:Ca2+-binding RTX toxin-like protein
MSLAENAIPQLIVQKVDIPQGDDNNVKQVINQDLIIYVLAIPDLENTASLQAFIQTDSDIGKNNQVSQNTRQTIPDFPLFPIHYTSPNSEAIDKNNLSLDFNEFINNDRILEAVQFSNQQIYVEGNNNSVDLYAQQIVYDLSWYDRNGLDSDYIFDENITFDDFLEDFAGNYLIDSVQVGVQDVRVFGGNNHIVQQLDQTLATFIFLDQDFALELQENSSGLPPVQFVFQESFLDSNNNTIEQIIHQNIQFDFSFSDEASNQLGELTGEQLRDPNFDIDDFILPILDNTVESSSLFENHEVLANQKNLQIVDTFGDNNTDIKDNSQIVVLGESETKQLVFGSPNQDNLVVGLSDDFDGLQDLVLTGKGDDRVDLSNAFVGLNISPFFIPTNTVVRAGKGSDRIIAYRGDEIYGDGDDDLLETAEGGGENSFYGGLGNDTIIAGTNDTLVGNQGDDLLNGNEGEEVLYGGKDDDTLNGNGGNDRLFGNQGDDLLNGNEGEDILYGGKDDDTLKGGDGNDQLWGNWGDDLLEGGEGIDTFVLGIGIDTIEDFQTGVDLIGLSGNLTFDELSFSQSNILLNNQILAILSGVDATSLTEADFVVMA